MKSYEQNCHGIGKADAMVRDVVCGMGVDEDSPESFSMQYHGTTYYFCSADCLVLFHREPDEYVNRHGGTAIARDCVCGMEVDATNAPARARYKDNDYYFCCESCKFEFLGDPGHYVEEF